MPNHTNTQSPMYSLEDYGIPTFGEASAREQREAFEANQDAVNTVARNLVVNRRIADQDAAKQVYGEVLGSMYKSDREAIEFMRNDIMTKYNSRQYARNPAAFAQAVANLNALIENSEGFYADSYGNTEHLTSQPQGLGTGTTFVDAKYNSLTNNEALTKIGKEPAVNIDGTPVDLFAEANGTFEKINNGTGYYDKDSMFMRDGELYVKVDGEEVRYQDLEYRTLGGLSYLPNLRDIGGQLELIAKNANTWAYISHRNGKWNEEDALDLFVDGMTNMEASDKQFRAAAWNSVAEGMGIKPELRQTFIDTGNFGVGKEKLFTRFSDEVKRVWLDATKKEEQVTPPKPPKPPTADEIKLRNRRLDLIGIRYQEETPAEEVGVKDRLRNVLMGIGEEDGFQGSQYANQIMEALSRFGINPSAEELAEGFQPKVQVTYIDESGGVNSLLISYPGGELPDEKIAVDDTQNTNDPGNIPGAVLGIINNLVESGALVPERTEIPNNPTTGREYAMPGLYEDERKIIVASKDDENIDIEIKPNKVVFFLDQDGGRGDIMIKNAFYDDGTSAGTFLIKKGSRNYDTAIKLLNRAIKSSYGEDMEIDMFFGLQSLPDDVGGGANIPAP